MVFVPAELYAPFEETISTMEVLDEMVDHLETEQRRDDGHRFAYRGVADAEHGFFSSLYRRLWWTEATQERQSLDERPPPDEDALAAAEDRVLAEMHRWGLHDAERGRLSGLRQLAVLQHNHAPTRLIDVSLNLWIALWFAVEEMWQDGGPQDDSRDGRLFAIDITDRLINDRDELRGWEDNLELPWSSAAIADWKTTTYAWQPSGADRRIAAQHGAFLFGGVPISATGHQYRRSTNRGDWLVTDELRRSTSLPLHFHKAGPGAGRPAHDATYTYRIPADLKPRIRERLVGLLGLSTGRIYPDLAGFGRFGTRWLVEAPPP
jgi:hypothetical protein